MESLRHGKPSIEEAADALELRPLIMRLWRDSGHSFERCLGVECGSLPIGVAAVEGAAFSNWDLSLSRSRRRSAPASRLGSPPVHRRAFVAHDCTVLFGGEMLGTPWLTQPLCPSHRGRGRLGRCLPHAVKGAGCPHKPVPAGNPGDMLKVQCSSSIAPFAELPPIWVPPASQKEWSTTS